jgi:hypothetical protein
MFSLSIEERISSWVSLRDSVETSHDPFKIVTEFWHSAPFVPFNKMVNPYHPQSWPTPWEIILVNQYDDFTKALMMAYSLKFTKKFNDKSIDIRICLDNSKNVYYNIVCVDHKTAINYKDFDTVPWESICESFLVENLIEVKPLG